MEAMRLLTVTKIVKKNSFDYLIKKIYDTVRDIHNYKKALEACNFMVKFLMIKTEYRHVCIIILYKNILKV